MALFLLYPLRTRVAGLVIAVIYVAAAAEEASESAHPGHAATEHSSESAGEAAHHLLAKSAEEAAFVHLGHEFPHLLVLADKLIDLGDGRAGALGDARFSAGIDDVVVGAFGPGH